MTLSLYIDDCEKNLISRWFAAVWFEGQNKHSKPFPDCPMKAVKHVKIFEVDLRSDSCMKYNEIFEIGFSNFSCR